MKNQNIDMAKIELRADKKALKVSEELYSHITLRNKVVLPNGVIRHEQITVPSEKVAADLGVSDIIAYVGKLPDLKRTAYIEMDMRNKVKAQAKAFNYFE